MEKQKYFASQQHNEEIIILTRAHPIVLLPLFITMGVIYLVGLLVVFLLPIYFPFFSEGSVPNVMTVVMSLYFLFGTLYFFIEWLLYYLRIGIVTNINVVDIHQKSLFSRKISELNLDNIEDVSASEEGVLQTMVHFGNVHIQTAGELPNFVFENVPHPYQTARRIMELKDNMLNHRNRFFETHTPKDLRDQHIGNFNPAQEVTHQAAPAEAPYEQRENYNPNLNTVQREAELHHSPETVERQPESYPSAAATTEHLAQQPEAKRFQIDYDNIKQNPETDPNQNEPEER